MKRYIRDNCVVVDVDVSVYHPIFALADTIAASHDLSQYKIPDSKVIAKDKERVTDLMKRDFASCMETVEDFCVENLGLVGTYKNTSKDDSYYYNYLATDESGCIILDYRMRLRISNHDAHRTQDQQNNKKAEENSPKLNDLLSYEEIKKLRKYSIDIRVNDEEFSTYFDAVDFILDRIEASVESMKKNSNYRKKKFVPERYRGDKGFDALPENTPE